MAFSLNIQDLFYIVSHDYHCMLFFDIGNYFLLCCYFCKQILEGLVRLPSNRECADCRNKYAFLMSFYYVQHKSMYTAIK